jgi:glycosyltransferase involved in cell wall biosynthesis
MIGPGDEDGRFREQAAATACADRITFTGRKPRAELGAYYELAEVFAFPSTADTQALVVNEAAWAATPIVMVDRNISQIVEDGVSGLYAADSPEGLAEKISTLLDRPEYAEALGRAARERAGKLTARIQAGKLARLYEETAGGRTAEPPELPSLAAA